MPISYRIDRERRLVVSRPHGVVRDEDMIAHQKALAADPDFDPTFDQLIEPEGVTVFQVSTAAYRRLAAESPFREGSRRAVVAPTEMGYGLSRMFEMRTASSGSLVRVFRTAKEARRWLFGSEPERGRS